MKEYLLELLNEEVPARFQEDATRMLKERMETACLSAGITVSFLEAYGTPRRLVLHGELAEEIPARTEERRGPKGEASEAILQSFLASLPAYAQTEKRETPKGSYWFALLSHPARPTQEVLPDLIAQVLTQFPWPKTMRWGSSSFAWVRPLRNILCLFAGVPLNFTFQGLQTTDETVGHRFLAPERFSVSDFSSYKAALSQRFVLLDRAERAEILKKQFQILEQRHNLIIVEDAALFAEVLGLVEWPVALLGKIDPQYQDLPEELIITPMRVHQRYFATRHKDGTLAPFFICVAGTKTADGGKRIVQGNEMVLRARLADARFFFETDKKIPLEQRTQALSQRIFHRRLGTVAERLPRLQAWGCLLQDLFQEEAFFQEVRSQDRERAIALCKADLGTEAVKEFPELQGIMGGYYAALQGESPAVATAIQEHYRPQGIKDAVPETSLGVLLALADKWEMIWSLFQIEERPTGSKDPFALRRAALGIIRILETHHLSLNLTSLFQQHTASEKETVTETCLSFFRERLKGRLKDMGISISVVSSLLEPQ
ncbi:MAG: glycine--tRNA ligase subunit beta, partial [Holosporales bacterium]|nr:glycine--tRNA ligase subunit beta [Holosporales bacterium]